MRKRGPPPPAPTPWTLVARARASVDLTVADVRDPVAYLRGWDLVGRKLREAK